MWKSYKTLEFREKFNNYFGLEPLQQEDWDDVHKKCAKRILELCKTNAALYIKAGQYLSSLNHVIPNIYVDTLRELQNNAPSIPYEEVKKVIESEFKKSINEIFLEFDKSKILLII